MPVTWDTYDAIRKRLWAGGGKLELKALPALPPRADLKAAFDALDDRFEASRATLKADIDGALGFTTTNALAKQIFRAWLLTKGERE